MDNNQHGTATQPPQKLGTQHRQTTHSKIKISHIQAANEKQIMVNPSITLYHKELL
jgi:hypothetical protein